MKDLDEFLQGDFSDAYQRFGDIATVFDLVDFSVEGEFTNVGVDRKLVESWLGSLDALRAIESGLSLEDAGCFKPLPPADPTQTVEIRELLSIRPDLNLTVLWALARSGKCIADSFRAYTQEESPSMALMYAFHAGLYAGIGGEHFEAIDTKKHALRSFHLKGADAIHVENRESKAQAIEYFKNNAALFTSLNDAASQIARKIVPYPYSTVRRWLNGLGNLIPKANRKA